MSEDTKVNEESNFSVQAPEDMGDVVDAVNNTFLGIWTAFLEHIPYLLAGVVVMLLTWLAVAMVRKGLTRTLTRGGVRGSLRELVKRLASIAIWAAGLLLTAMFWFPGLTPTTALGGIGLLSVAIGLAFQDIFENFFAGVLLLWRFPFENGDFIECDGIMGEVEDITVRMTQLRLTTGEMVLVPNAILYKNPVNILTNNGKRRVSITCGVSYDTDIEQAVEAITTAVKRCKSVTGSKPIQVFPEAFGSSSIDIEVAWWTDARPVDIRSSRGEVIQSIKRELDDREIEIPFPYRTLTFKESLPVTVSDSE